MYLADDPTLPWRWTPCRCSRLSCRATSDFRARFVRQADVAAALEDAEIVSFDNRGETDVGQRWIAFWATKATATPSSFTFQIYSIPTNLVEYHFISPYSIAPHQHLVRRSDYEHRNLTTTTRPNIRTPHLHNSTRMVMAQQMPQQRSLELVRHSRSR
ncbi:hypothetical protein [Mycolicibacterium moriokaense]|uniref:hypothetical protein n=1 Tax=Mycolicibacterium moriokaense TaxID=39691 RepID=UPI0011B35D07